jgi:neutral ceramidase
MTKKLLTLLITMMLSISSFASTDLIDVGLSTINLDLPEGVPLSGFGQPSRRMKGGMDIKNKYPYCFFFKPNEGVLDPVNVRTMALRKDGKLVVFISMDVVGITNDFVKVLVKRLKDYGITRDNLNLSGTHTHAGPGALSHSFVLGLIAADIFNQKLFNHVMLKVEQSVIKAILNLEPAYLYDLTYKTAGLQKNRRGHPGHFDPNARLLLAKNIKGDWLGGIFNYAIHGTFYGGSNLKLSADAPGAMVNALENQFNTLNLFSNSKPTILFINGAEGDVAPHRVGGRNNIAAMGTSISSQTMENLPNARPVLNPKIKFNQEKVFVGIPRLNIKKCIDSPKFSKLIPGFLKLPLIKLFPMKTVLSTVTIGDLTMMTWPGEPTTTVGYQLADMAIKAGHKRPWLLGLTNDHLSYFTTKAEQKEGGYEACSSFYGHKGTKRIIKKYSKMLTK